MPIAQVDSAVAAQALDVLGNWLTFVRILIGIGLIPLFHSATRAIWHAYRWDRFSRSVDDWIVGFRSRSLGDLSHFSEATWEYEVQLLLHDSNFTPFEVKDLIPTAVIYAKGIATQHFLL